MHCNVIPVKDDLGTNFNWGVGAYHGRLTLSPTSAGARKVTYIGLSVRHREHKVFPA